ncbi:MAG: class II glutamine amidotransferase [Candidatus Aenigmatarchaeota archaeon]
MCGIGAVVVREGNAWKRAKEILVGQENRGSSSSGIAYIENGEIKILKDTVEPKEFVKKYEVESKVVITHSRAPSVGRVCLENAHPFMSCDGRFALVHNGTFSEYRLIKGLLLSEHLIKGETDSEVICHFIEDYGGIKGYKEILQNFSPQKIILLFKDRIMGVGEFYIVRDKVGVYVVQEYDVLVNMFKGERKVVYEVDGFFECKFEDLNLTFEGEVEKKRVRLVKRKEKIIDIDEWFEDEESQISWRRWL